MIMKVVESQGYNKEKALEATGLDIQLNMFKNATLAWKKAGSVMNTKELNAFMEAYMRTNRLIGAYLVIDQSSDDTRIRPYSIINEVTKGKRKSTTTYQIKEGDLKVKYNKVVVDGEEIEVPSVEVLGSGAVEARADKKDLAFKITKELIEENKKNYVIEIVKEITAGQKYAGFGLYTPSKSAKLGKFLFFVQE